MSIEEREDGLGALPVDRIEEQVISPSEAGAVPEGQGVPVDIRRQEGVEAIPTLPERNMSQGASVRSVYDSRPINAKDFIDSQFETVDIPFSDPGIIQVNFDFFVPGGFVAVLRGFHYELEEPVLTATRTSVRCSILVNDIIQLGYDNLLLGQTNGSPCPDSSRSWKNAVAEKPASRVWSRSNRAPTFGPFGPLRISSVSRAWRLMRPP